MIWDGDRILNHDINENEVVLSMLRKPGTPSPVYIEMVASYGMAVGRDVFETCRWIGRFTEACEVQNRTVHMIFRRDVKLHHCMSARAKDANVRQVLLDKYGSPGTKKNPVLTYGLKKDLWSAFAIAAYITGRNFPELPLTVAT